MSSNLTQERLHSLLDYDPETGAFIRKPGSNGHRRYGHSAGTSDRHGYVRISVDGVIFSAHRLAFLWMTGSFPNGEVDHINGSVSDNSWENLREVSKAENAHNMCRPYRNGTSGFLGVSFDKNSGKWSAGISINRSRKHLGLFQSKEDAYQAYLKAKDELHPTHLRLRTKP